MTDRPPRVGPRPITWDEIRAAAIAEFTGRDVTITMPGHIQYGGELTDQNGTHLTWDTPGLQVTLEPIKTPDWPGAVVDATVWVPADTEEHTPGYSFRLILQRLRWPIVGRDQYWTATDLGAVGSCADDDIIEVHRVIFPGIDPDWPPPGA